MDSYNYTTYIAYIDLYMLCIHVCVCVADLSLLCKVTALQSWQKKKKKFVLMKLI